MTVVNVTDGTATGTQNLGTITVATNGANPTGMLTYADDRVTLPVATASGSVEDQFKEIRMYTGDTDN